MSIDRWNPLAGPSCRALAERVEDLETEVACLQRAIRSVDEKGGALIVELRQDIAQLKSSQDWGAPVSNVR